MNTSIRNELFRSGPKVGENRTKNALLLTATSTTEAQEGDNNAKALKRTLSAQRESEYTNAKEFPRNDMSEFRRACEKVKQFMLGDNELKTIRDRLLENMRRGLDREGHKSAKVKMLPSFVTHLPDGRECGTFIALDLGGTNFRVLLIDINEEQIDMDSQIYRVPQECMTGTGEALFDHIAKCMSDFINRMGFADRNIACGFTFSFPCEQYAINSASLITWTKGFSASDVEGKDVVTLLTEAVARRGDITVEIVAVVNDTVGTLMSCAFEDHACQIGLIAGTGSNACYMEKQSNITKLDELQDIDGKMCINMEWGAFGDDGALDEWTTEYDRVLDANSVHPTKQRFEKMMAGMYIGEIVRLILLDMCKEGIVFTEDALEILETPESFGTHMVSQIVDNQPRHFAAVQNILACADIGAIRRDCEIVHMVCDAVSRRAAYMCAAGISAIAIKIHQNRPDEYLDITCGVDGSVYKKHPTFAKLLKVKTNELVGLGIFVNFRLSHDGSGKGAALVSAVSTR
ncbi:Oidioi.mRNA.OKI2018_I69.XSR.g16011.t1.cds [Oikopleura dioica]|uniref:Phosphotransferase n=1 Tax=Oikopleura dioica TaxID=34765 RepID=A0ABN7SGK6_OIKDI|nr:Oidioi.mRNA.OKI2018_I69.XSR.g16011.t1.cds [Oikopleura dioica]